MAHHRPKEYDPKHRCQKHSAYVSQFVSHMYIVELPYGIPSVMVDRRFPVNLSIFCEIFVSSLWILAGSFLGTHRLDELIDANPMRRSL